MSCLTVRGVSIGEGRPKTILPIVERTEESILARAAEFTQLPADCVEWRADWFDAVTDPAALQSCLYGLRGALGEKLLLVTFRTAAEGGEKALTFGEYAAFCAAVCGSGCADLIDLELYPAGEFLPTLIAMARGAGVRSVCSSHDFEKTPPKEALVSRLLSMRDAGADIAKVAVMPKTPEDVLTLLAATAEVKAQAPELPLITMSMGPLGAVSRVCGEAFGSAMTFACAGKASAPGQIELEAMNRILDSLRLTKV